MKKTLVFLLFFIFLSFGAEASLIYNETIPSIVKIESSDNSGNLLYGSGFFMSTDSYILTVAHILIDTKTNKPYPNINICTIKDEYSAPVCKYSAEIIAINEDYDLAIIAPEYHLDEKGEKTSKKVDINLLKNPYIDLADMLPRIGEKLTILGFPNASQLSGITLTEGIVSGFFIDEEGLITEIATDATINPGNSGGPAYNANESATGVVIAISTDGIGGNYGYVISNELIQKWFYELVADFILNPEFVEEVFSNDDYLNVNEIFELEEGEKIFTDVDSTNQYAVAINFLKSSGILNGYADGSFKPFAEINRAELLKVLVMANGIEPSNAYGNCFPDVKDEWFAPYVCYAKISNWVAGYQDGNFKPAQSVSKSEALKMIFNAFQIENMENEYEFFRDVKIGSWFFDYVNTADVLGILDDEGYFFRPNSSIMRGQLSEYIFRTLAYY
jgi:V8-like Glu-specific endopeptidase